MEHVWIRGAVLVRRGRGQMRCLGFWLAVGETRESATDYIYIYATGLFPLYNSGGSILLSIAPDTVAYN